MLLLIMIPGPLKLVLRRCVKQNGRELTVAGRPLKEDVDITAESEGDVM